MVDTIGEGTDFVDYETTSYDPGWRFTLIIVAVCVIINATLPLWLRLGKKREETEEERVLGAQDEGIAANSTVSGSVMSRLLNGPKSVVSGTSSAVATDVASAILAARPRRNPGTHLKGPRVKGSANSDVGRNVRLAAGRVIIAENSNNTRTNYGLSNCGSMRDDRSIASISIMSKLDHDAISVRDAVDAKDAGTTPLSVSVHNASRGWKKILEIADYDKEMRKFGALAFPFAAQGFIKEFFAIVDVAVIGHFIGVTEANAYVIVNILVLFTGTLTKGFAECA